MSEKKILLERVPLIAGALGLLYYFGGNHPPVPSGPIAIPITLIARFGVWALPPGIYLLWRFLKSLEGPARVTLVGPRTFILCCAVYFIAVAILFLASPHNFSLAAPFLASLITAVFLFDGMGKDNPHFPSRSIEWRIGIEAGLAAFVAVVGLLSLLTLIASVLYPSLVSGVSLPEQRVNLRTDLIEIFLGVLLVPFLEEILFRAGVIGFLIRYTGAATAVIGSAIFFSAIHMQNDLFLARLIGGLFMGVLYVRTGSIIPSFVLHSLLNFSIMFVVPLMALLAFLTLPGK